MTIRHAAKNAMHDLTAAITDLATALAHDHAPSVQAALNHIDTAQRELSLAMQDAQSLGTHTPRMTAAQLLAACERKGTQG